MMLEVCERFNITIADFQSLPPGEKALYKEYTKFKIESEAKLPPALFSKK